MAEKYYDVAIFGATFLGLGAALELENVVVIEKRGLLGAEYVNSFKICEPKEIEVQTELGKTFAEDSINRGLVSESGDIYSAPAVYVLSSYLVKKHIDILQMTEVISLEKQDDYFEIKVYHSAGFETIYAKRIIDTTSLGVGHNTALQYKIRKQLNSIVYNPDTNEEDNLYYNKQNGLYTYVLPVEMDVDRYDAVEQLCDMEDVFVSNNLQISSIASEFSYIMEPCRVVIEEKFEWIPSVAYANLIEAFDKGVQIAKEVRK